MLLWLTSVVNKRDGDSCAVHYLNPSRSRFREIIDTLHISFSYRGEYPEDDVDEEFQRYRDIVKQFVDDLEQAASGNLP